MTPLRQIAPKAEPTRSSPHSGRIAKRCHNQHSKDEWEAKRDVISRLYIQERKSAKAVVEMLKTDASGPFVTSRRQLFTKLKEWDIAKKPRKHQGPRDQHGILPDLGDISSPLDIDETPSSFQSPGFSDHVSLARSPSEAFTSPNESQLSPGKDSGYEPETSVLEGDSRTTCPGPQQPDCHGDRSRDAQNDQAPGRRELSYAIDAFDEAFIEVDNTEDNPSWEVEFPRVGDGDSASTGSTNQQLADLLDQFGNLLSWVSSERKVIEKRGNGITCEGDKPEWELAVETWVEREKLSVREREEEQLQGKEYHVKGYSKPASHISDGSKPEDRSTDLDANGTYLGPGAQKLRDHIDEINSAYCAADDSHDDRPLHQPRSQKPSHATPNAHQTAGEDFDSSDPTPAYLVDFNNQDQHDLDWVTSYCDRLTYESSKLASNCIDSSSVSYHSPEFLWTTPLSLFGSDVHILEQEDETACECRKEDEQQKLAWEALDRLDLLLKDNDHGQIIMATQGFLHSRKLTRKTLRTMDRSLEEERRQNIRRFRGNFMHQHRLLVDTVRQYPIWLNPLVNQLRSHRDAWDSVVSTMRRLSQLEAPLTLEDALCFLCASRAVVESSSEDEKLASMSSFAQDLETWREMFPQVEHFARIMWDLAMDHIPPTFRATDAASWHHTILALREVVATLVARTRFLFGLEEYGSVTEPDIPAEPDSRVCPNITRLRHIAANTPTCDPAVVVLATGFIFALVIQFILGFVHMLSTQTVGLPNLCPSRIGSSPGKLCSPSMLSRPSTPLAQWRPNLDPSSPSPDPCEFSDYFSRFF